MRSEKTIILCMMEDIYCNDQMPNSPHHYTKKHMAPTKENHYSDLGVKGLTLLKAADKQAPYSYSAILANRLTPISLSIVALQIACLLLVFDNGVVTRCILLENYLLPITCIKYLLYYQHVHYIGPGLKMHLHL